MKRATLTRPELSHEAASLLAQLALRTTMPAEEIEALHELLLHYPSGRILDALDRAIFELVAEGHQPEFPDYNGNADAYLTMVSGLRGLDKLEHTYLSIAA